MQHCTVNHGHVWSECKIRTICWSPEKIDTSPLFPTLFCLKTVITVFPKICVAFWAEGKLFFRLGLWHIWQATWCTAVNEDQMRASTLMAYFLSRLPSTSLMFYVPASYFSHLKCAGFRKIIMCTVSSRKRPSCLLSISSHYLKIHKFLKDWHEAIKTSAFSSAVADTCCFFGRYWFCIIIVCILTLPPIQKEQKDILFFSIILDLNWQGSVFV